jgi:hypothetical protein
MAVVIVMGNSQPLVGISFVFNVLTRTKPNMTEKLADKKMRR